MSAGVSGSEDTIAAPVSSAASVGTSGGRLTPGEVVGRYVIECLLGAGGMAEVYRGHDQQLGRPVALKLVRPLQEGDACGMLCSLLMREARTLASLSHPGLLTVHDVGEHRGCVYLAMELIDGTTLRAWAEATPDWRERLAVLLQAGEALNAAHSARVVHRDVKPDNVLVGHSGRVVVSDFGVARNLASFDDQGHQCGCAGGATVRVDLDGKVVGTPHYMSPEQHEGLSVDARSDQFSYAVTCWEMLHGGLPFEGDDLAAVRREVFAQRVLPPATDTPIPTSLSQALVRGMRLSASARYPNMDAFIDTLKRAAG